METMRWSRISPSVTVWFSAEKSDFCSFETEPLLHPSKFPNSTDEKKEVVGFILDYAFTGEQDGGIEKLAEKFQANNDTGVINKVPKDLSIVEENDFCILKISDKKIDFENEYGLKKLKEAKLIGYWSKLDLILICYKEYRFILEAVLKLLKKRKITRIFTKYRVMGTVLVVSSLTQRE